ncbi:MAG: hypothetical protein FJ088_01065, partial [Deltaproteobacteria bacterium]|nr:hypothetical protein [Deltaproteobacteria bacterium]
MDSIRAIFFATVFFSISCGSGGKGGDDVFDADIQEEEIEEIAGDVEIQEFEAGEVTINEKFRVLYGYRGRLLDNEDEHDLHIMEASEPEKSFNLTKFSLENTGYNCNLGCVTDRGLEWIAVAYKETEIQEDFDYKLGRFTTAMTVDIDKISGIKAVTDIKFGGGFLYFSKKLPEKCAENPPSYCYDIYRVDLSNLSKMDKIITFPPIEKAAGSLYKGHFHLSEDGKTVVLLNPTIGSQNIYIWRDGKLAELDYICHNLEPGGKCIGTGSQNTDKDPLAVSPDGNDIVIFLIEDNREFNVRRYNIKDNWGKYSNLLKVPSDYSKNACYNKKEWQYTYVRGTPIVRGDGRIYFIGEAKCGNTKTWTNLVSMDISIIGDGTAITEEEIVKITDNPKGNTSRNVEIFNFDFSTEGNYVVFAGTPMFQVDGYIIPDSSQRHFNDREIWIINRGGGPMAQLTNSLQFLVSSP